MKFNILILLLLLPVFLVTGCAEPDEIIIRKDGRWKVERFELYEYEAGILQNQTDINGEVDFMTFLVDGSVIYENEAGERTENVEVTWDYDEDSEVVTMIEQFSLPAFPVRNTYIFNVLDSDRNEQDWQDFQVEDSSGTEFRTEIYLDLERAE